MACVKTSLCLAPFPRYTTTFAGYVTACDLQKSFTFDNEVKRRTTLYHNRAMTTPPPSNQLRCLILFSALPTARSSSSSMAIGPTLSLVDGWHDRCHYDGRSVGWPAGRPAPRDLLPATLSFIRRRSTRTRLAHRRGGAGRQRPACLPARQS